MSIDLGKEGENQYADEEKQKNYGFTFPRPFKRHLAMGRKKVKDV